MMRVKKDDTVVVLSGKDKGKKGTVIEILPKKDKVKVKDVAVVTKHAKARRQGETSSIKKVESYVDASNVMPMCPSCKKPTRVGFQEADEKKSRVCKRCNETF